MNDILDTSEVPDIVGLEWIGSDEAQAKLVAALAAARLEFGSIDKDREGQYGNQRFKYSPLGTLTEATAKPLARHGIVCIQSITNSPKEGKHRLHTTIAGHGARIVASLDFAPQQAKEEGSYKGEWIKEYGKLCTYLCRYAYKTAFVLDSEPDADDAPSEQPQKRREAPTPPQPRQEPRPAPAPKQAAPVAQEKPEPAKQLAIVPTATIATIAKPDPLAEKLSTPVTPPEPTQSGTPVRVEDGPASQELETEFLKEFAVSGMTKIQFGQWCLNTLKVSSQELRKSEALMRQALEALRALKKPAAGAA